MLFRRSYRREIYLLFVEWKWIPIKVFILIFTAAYCGKAKEEEEEEGWVLLSQG